MTPARLLPMLRRRTVGIAGSVVVPFTGQPDDGWRAEINPTSWRSKSAITTFRSIDNTTVWRSK